MIQDPYATRLLRFRKLLNDRKLDAFFVAVPENRYYLSGFEAEDLQLTESSGYLLITDSCQYLLTDFRYEEEGKREAPGFELVIYKDGLLKALPDLFMTIGADRVGAEGHHLTYGRYREVEEALKEARPSASVVATDGLVEQLRIVKEPDEIERLKASLALSERVLRTVWEDLRPGAREREVAWTIERLIREGGGEAVSFPPIAASGPNAALPHAVPTGREIAEGEPLILDMGSRLNHYCSDMTRTWICGTPAEKLREIYRIVRDAQLAAQDVIRAGMDSVQVDAAARQMIGEAGYGERFGHGLGHGVGLAVHEEPRLRKQEPTVLEENMVVTVEPGIYLPGFGGVRLENMVRITRSGCEVLNREDLFYSW